VKHRVRSKLILTGVLLSVCCAPPAAFACATCYGASDAPMAQGMNWGIMTLLTVIFSVLTGVVAFFVHVGRKSAALHRRQSSPARTDQLP